MTSIRLLCYPAAVLLILSACSLCSTSATRSLWGQKLKFKGTPCLWRLRPEAVIPALEELSVCMLVKRPLLTKWTGFVYKAPGKREIELGLGGSGKQLTVWLFGKEWKLQVHMTLKEWHYFCITWSGKAQRLKIYINGQTLHEAVLPIPSQRLAPNGTLSLGVSHFSVNGEVERESGTDLVGEISLFRVWSREYDAEELKRLSCVDGDVVSWAKDLQQWKYDCPPEPDSSQHCAWSHYKIQMQTSIVQSNYSSNSPESLENITNAWLKRIFPNNISVQDISVSFPSHSCYMVNSSTPPQVQQPQGMDAQSNSSCDKCFLSEVFVNVHPATKVDVVQAHITSLLNLNFPSEFPKLSADPDTISILPVGLLATESPQTLSTAVSGEYPTPSPTPDDVSTTAEPSDCNHTSVERDHFFKVNLTLNMTDSPPKPEDIIENWLEKKLEHDFTTMLNPIIKDISGKNVTQYMGLMISHRKQKRFECTFHVQVKGTISQDEAENLINTSLMSQSENDSIVIAHMPPLNIVPICPGICLEEQTDSAFYGHYIWPETSPQAEAEMICQKPDTERAFRLCKLDFKTDKACWAEPNFTNCESVVTIPSLDNVPVTPDNADEVVDVIQELVNVELGNGGELSPSNLNSVVEKLNEVVNISIIRPNVGHDIVNIIANILDSKTNVSPVANTVLYLTKRMGDNMDLQNESLSITAPSLALSMINAQPDQFSGLTFGVSSLSSTLKPDIFLNQSFVGDPFTETVATISLPSALQNLFQPGEANRTRIQFQFYATQELFEDPASSTQSNWIVDSYIVSASINNSRVVNLPLEDRVVVTLTHKPLQQPGDQVHCMFWDFQMNDGRSGWNSSGCEKRSISPSQTSCLCDHLTHFALLLDVSRTPISATDNKILTIMSNIGCGISCIFLGLTLITYILFEKLRSDNPSKILINLSAALLGLAMVFLVNSWLSSFSNYGLCIATAATLHYFLLASFSWMGLEAVHMYLALVRVFNTYIPSYILKFCAVGWGIPLVIVSLVLAIDIDVYGSIVSEEDSVLRLQATGPFCWLQNDTYFYVTVMAFILLILLGNVVVFIVVLIQIRRTRANKPTDNSSNVLRDLRAVASLTVLLGLTWSMDLFAFGPGKVVMMYLFVIFNSLQGFFVFLFHCLMKENVRKQWRTDLRCSRFRFDIFFLHRSRSETEGGRTKRNHLNSSDSFFSDSRATLGSSATSSSNKYCHQGA